ncbi:hypothetical protein WDA38_18965, partial [Acinetobacter pittii]|nr:hypothetical protein [Acinetobacter pittii]
TYPSYALNLAQLGALCISNLCATKPIISTAFSIFPIFYFGLLFLYIFNYFFRGLGTGKVIIPLEVPSKKRKRTRKV